MEETSYFWVADCGVILKILNKNVENFEEIKSN